MSGLVKVFQYIYLVCHRFLYTSRNISNSDIMKIFTGIQVVFRLSRPNNSAFEVLLRIYRPVISQTLSSLLSCPLRWKYWPSAVRRIGAVSSISLVNEGALVGDTPQRNAGIFRNEAMEVQIDVRECVQHDKMEETFREVARLVPTKRADSNYLPHCVFSVNPGATLDACLANVSLLIETKRRQNLYLFLLRLLDSSRTLFGKSRGCL